MTTKPYLSVIIPLYDEADNLKKGSLEQVCDYLKSRVFTWEMLLVNDGSTDDTLKIIQAFSAHHPGVRVIDNPHQGKAATVAAGVFNALGKYLLFTDTDQATPISEFDKFKPLLDQGFQVVIGSRTGRKGAPLYRQILALGMPVFRTLILQVMVRDSQCGFKAFSTDLAVKIFKIIAAAHPPKSIRGPSTNPGFDVEFLFLARRMGHRIAEVPVFWTHRESNRVSFFKDSVNGLKELLLIRWRSVRGAYKI